MCCCGSSNAGLRMHLPSVVGLPMALVAEDGNLQPDQAVGMTKLAHTACPSGLLPIAGACPKVQSDWFMAAGKVLDVMCSRPLRNHLYGGRLPGVRPRVEPVGQRDRARQRHASSGALNAGTRTVNATTGVTTLSGVTLPAGLTANAAANNDSFIVPHGATTFSANVLANDVGMHNASSPCTAGGSTGPQAISPVALATGR